MFSGLFNFLLFAFSLTVCICIIVTAVQACKIVDLLSGIKNWQSATYLMLDSRDADKGDDVNKIILKWHEKARRKLA